MTSRLGSALALAVLAAGMSSQARADVWWTLKDVAFSDGGGATGSFFLIPDPYYAVGPVTTTTGSAYAGYGYDFGSVDRTTFETVTFMLGGSPLQYYNTLTLTFAHPLTTAIAENAIVGGFECDDVYACTSGTAARIVTAGSAAAPEAPTWAMMIAGMALLGFAATRRERRRPPLV